MVLVSVEPHALAWCCIIVVSRHLTCIFQLLEVNRWMQTWLGNINEVEIEVGCEGEN